jgi:hypothetical protein
VGARFSTSERHDPFRELPGTQTLAIAILLMVVGGLILATGYATRSSMISTAIPASGKCIVEDPDAVGPWPTNAAFLRVERPLLACVWETVVISAERNAWVETMLATAPQPSLYLDTRLPDGGY